MAVGVCGESVSIVAISNGSRANRRLHKSQRVEIFIVIRIAKIIQNFSKIKNQ